MWHYMLVNQHDRTIVLNDSSRREQFSGYESQEIAKTVGDDRRYELKLPHYYKPVTFMVIDPSIQPVVHKNPGGYEPEVGEYYRANHVDSLYDIGGEG